MSKLGKKIFDIIRPVGGYYDTSDINFNPNTAYGWYGTWVEDTEGQVLVSRNNGTFATVGANIGEETHTLTVNEMPSHNHSAGNGVVSESGSNYSASIRNDGSAFKYMVPIGNKGGNQPHNNIQPSKVAIRWHRIA